MTDRILSQCKKEKRDKEKAGGPRVSHRAQGQEAELGLESCLDSVSFLFSVCTRVHSLIECLLRLYLVSDAS